MNPFAASDTMRGAAEALNAGRLDDAERLARLVLASRPHEPDALDVLGCVALNRDQPEEALRLFKRVRATRAKDPFLHFNLAEAHRRVGSLDEALRHYRKAAQLRPEFAEAHGQAGEILRTLGRGGEAATAYEAALRLRPDLPNCLAGFALLLMAESEFGAAVPFFEAALRATPATMSAARAACWANLGSARMEAGETLEGLAALVEATACVPDNAGYWRLLAHRLLHVSAVPSGPGFRTALVALFGRADIDPRLLATAAIAALRQEPALDELLARLAKTPDDTAEIIRSADATVHAVLGDALFLALLSSTPIPDVGLEVLLTHQRRNLIMETYTSSAGEPSLAFVRALARQCFLNEYAYWADAEEEATLTSLCAALDLRGAVVEPTDWSRVAVVACYVALHRTDAAHLDFASAPPPVRILARDQLDEPAQEQALAGSLTPLKAGRDAVSLAVQDQYEENPYPRWTRAQLGTPRSLRDVAMTALPHLSASGLPTAKQIRVLVAGCGTGVQTMRVVQSVADASVLAIDLSRSSLAYSMRKLAEYGVGSVRHLQADILDFADLDEHFELIECFGVLHHMRVPLEGLRILSGLLAPGGLMFLGLYSEIARASVVAGRTLIADLALAPTPTGVRAGRRTIMRRSGSPDLGKLLSPASDFWTLSECRDLIFHVAEHRFILPEIGAMLETCGLEFLGLELDRPLDRARFAAEHPDRSAVRSLAAWHAFETHYPDTFGDTYRIWARRL